MSDQPGSPDSSILWVHTQGAAKNVDALQVQQKRDLDRIEIVCARTGRSVSDTDSPLLLI